MRRSCVWPRKTSMCGSVCSYRSIASDTLVLGFLILVSLMGVERIDEDPDRILLCLSRATSVYQSGDYGRGLCKFVCCMCVDGFARLILLLELSRM